MSLENWLENKWLKRHVASAEQVAELIKIVDRDIETASNKLIDADRRLNIAFNAALQSAALALYASGYRVSAEAHHERIIKSLGLTIGASETTVRQLDRLRRKRITNTYDAAGLVSDQEVSEALALALKVRDEVLKWIREVHPELKQ